MDLGGGLVAEDSLRTRAQYGGPKLGFPGQGAREGRVNPAVQTPPGTRPEPPVDDVFPETGISCLLPRHDTVL